MNHFVVPFLRGYLTPDVEYKGFFPWFLNFDVEKHVVSKKRGFVLVSSGLWKTRYRRMWSSLAKWPDYASGNGLKS
jgi:hypothetical protein